MANDTAQHLEWIAASGAYGATGGRQSGMFLTTAQASRTRENTPIAGAKGVLLLSHAYAQCTVILEEELGLTPTSCRCLVRG